MPAISVKNMNSTYSLPIIQNNFPALGFKVAASNGQTTGVGVYVDPSEGITNGVTVSSVLHAMVSNMVSACNAPAQRKAQLVCDGFALPSCTPDATPGLVRKRDIVPGEYTNTSSRLSASFTASGVSTTSGTGTSPSLNLTYTLGFFASQANDSVVQCLIANAKSSLQSGLQANPPVEKKPVSAGNRQSPIKATLFIAMLLASASLAV